MIYGNHRKELSAGFRKTTNNRMELLAVIVALEALKKPNLQVEIFTDSKYVEQAVTKGWVFGWEKKGFKGKKNPDLWRRFLVIYRRHKVSFKWVKGHAGNPLNERCDQLAVEASLGPDLPASSNVLRLGPARCGGSGSAFDGREKSNPRANHGSSLRAPAAGTANPATTHENRTRSAGRAGAARDGDRGHAPSPK